MKPQLITRCAMALALAAIGLLVSHYAIKKGPTPIAPTKPPVQLVTKGTRLKTGNAESAAQVDGQRAEVRDLIARAAAQQLVSQMTQADLGRGVLSPEQAQQLKQQLKQLIAQGAVAVPAIREFLEKNQDLAFGPEAAKTVGFPSLRAGFLDALRQIGGLDALAASRAVLQDTTDPLEIALCTRTVEELAPGQYRAEALEVARQRLAQAAEGKLGTHDVAPLFQVLQTYGDARVAADLERAASKWNLYSVMALAGLPAGQGIPSLTRLAMAPPAGTEGKLAFQMLAQAAGQQLDAAAALVDLARQGQISDPSWVRVVYGLSGAQYGYSRKLPENTFAVDNVSAATAHHDDSGSQIYYSAPLQAGAMTEDQLNQRQGVIDQLLAVTTNAVAAQALQRTRARMQRMNLASKP